MSSKRHSKNKEGEGRGGKQREREKEKGRDGVRGENLSSKDDNIFFNYRIVCVCVWRSLGFLFIINNDFVSDKIDGFLCTLSC